MDLAVVRDDMVEGLEHPSKGAVRSEAVSLAMRTVPRHEFVPGKPEAAYEDRAFEQHGTTVLAPSTAARLVEALDLASGQSVLIVGVGVGYTAALASEIVDPASVSAVDLSRQLVIEARRNLARAGYGAVFVDCRDGAGGLPEYAPFDRVLVEAAGVRPPQALAGQLASGGRLVMPIGAADQQLVAIEAESTETREAARFGPVRFRPLLVDGEQAGGVERNRTLREDRELAERAHERRRGWEHGWIDWEQDGGRF